MGGTESQLKEARAREEAAIAANKESEVMTDVDLPPSALNGKAKKKPSKPLNDSA